MCCRSLYRFRLRQRRHHKVAIKLEIQWVANGIQKPVANQDLWEQLDQAVSDHQVNWHWVKGHSGDPGNERADELANQGVSSVCGK